MKLYKHFYIAIILLICIKPVFSQTVVFEKDTVFLSTHQGKLIFEGIEDTTKAVFLNGKFDFQGQNLSDSLFKKLSIQGSFSNNSKNSAWKIAEQIIVIQVDNVNLERKVPELDYTLKGYEYNLLANYEQGIPQGNWKLMLTNVEGSTKNSTELLTLNFNRNGKPQGRFLLRGAPNEPFISAIGRFDQNGFLDDILEIKYQVDSDVFTETRTYENGFLISIEVFKGKELVESLIYEDVRAKLNEIKSEKKIDFGLSEKGFGLTFNIGYSAFNRKITTQTKGNAYLEQIFKQLDHFLNLNTGARLEIPFTRRFRILYPESEMTLVKNIKTINDSILLKTTDFLEKPSFLINKQKSQKLTEAYAFLEKANQKSIVVAEVINKIENGFFDFIQRDNYYKNGIEGLNVVDSISFEYNNKLHQLLLELPVITNSTQLLEDLLSFSNILKEKTKKQIDYSYNELKIFDQEASIDSLDSRIVIAMKAMDSIYKPLKESYGTKDFKDRPISYNIIEMIQNNLIAQNNKSYIAETDFNKKINTGEELKCLLSFTPNNIESLRKLDDFKNRIDNLFTIYRDNPFLDRMMESKVYNNINRKSKDVLFSHYVNMILRSKNCGELKQNLQYIDNLEKKLRALVKQNDDEVQRIDRFLRSENVPARIERILGLNY